MNSTTCQHIVNRTVRTFNLTEEKRELPAMRAHMIAGGWDGSIWHGVSPKTAGMKKEIAAMFYREAKTQIFRLVTRF